LSFRITWTSTDKRRDGVTLPQLDTERLILRVHTVADFADSAAMWADPEVTRFIGGRPSTEEEVWQRLLRYGGLWALLGFGYWVVRERSSGRFVGEVGLADFHRDLVPSFGDTPESGWALAPWASGRGYATEALGGVLAWADGQTQPAALAERRTVCMITPGNAPSVRVAEKCGYRRMADAQFKGNPTMVFERCHP
jgi:RimJ/RimL family protein N-acetyltransferase